ncbi:MAG: glycosyltransferase [Selenomonadales bacterium]|nr:glycosyltransferase [Selenomonadales bacterium]
MVLGVDNPSTLRVVFLLTGLDVGGAEQQVVNLAVALRLRGWQVGVISLLPLKALADDLRHAGVVVETLHMRRGVPDPRAVWALARILRQWKPDVLHSHMVHANILGRITRLLQNVPVLISTAHSINEGGRWREVAYRLTDGLADVTTNVSHAATERYIRIGVAPEAKIMTVPNGVDIAKFALNPALARPLLDSLGVTNEFVWLAVGRLESPKDYPTLLSAFKIANAASQSAKLLVAGHGPLMPDMIQLTAKLGLSQKVLFLGVRRDVPALMNVADAYVMSSVYEGLPMALLEAAASGLPIVATNVSGNSEAVPRDGGYLVPPGDAEALAEAMVRVMALTAAERQSMGEAGRRHVEDNYSLGTVVARWEMVYFDMLSRKTSVKG